MPYYYIHRNRECSLPYEKALHERGYYPTTDSSSNIDFWLIDYEAADIQDKLQRTKRPVFIYPHSANSEVLWDGMYKPYPVKANFTIGLGQVKVMNSYGYPYPVVACGWPWSKMVTLTYPKNINTILFAPKHPNPKGKGLRDEDRLHNTFAMKKILEYIKRNGGSLVVRLFGTPESNGLERWINSPKIVWQKANLSLSCAIEALESVDVVVSTNTHAYTSVALGKPTIFTHQYTPNTIFAEARHFDRYKKWRVFPITIDMEDPFAELLNRKHDHEIEYWKNLFISHPFDAWRFTNTIFNNLKG